ncbi:DUF2969 domain-containing protein [Dellaglioa sp. BT-FLS60]
MSKKEKEIEVAENDIKINGEDAVSLTVGGIEIGTVMAKDTKFVATLSNGEIFKAKTRDEGIDTLLRDFHLHRG